MPTLSSEPAWLTKMRSEGRAKESGGVMLGKPGLPEISERDFQTELCRIATMHGWMYYHTHDSRKSVSGFPDLVLVRETVYFVELKTDSGTLTAAQETWGERLVESGANYRVFRPADWGEIISILTKPIE